MRPKGHPWAALGRLEALLGCFWAVLGRSWGALGASWDALGGLLDASWGVLEASRATYRKKVEGDPENVPFWHPKMDAKIAKNRMQKTMHVLIGFFMLSD